MTKRERPASERWPEVPHFLPFLPVLRGMLYQALLGRVHCFRMESFQRDPGPSNRIKNLQKALTVLDQSHEACFRFGDRPEQGVELTSGGQAA
jgi:hypothetical protein